MCEIFLQNLLHTNGGLLIARGVTIEWAALYDDRRSTLAGIIGARGPDGNELMRSRIEIERSPAFQMPACDI